MVSFHLVQLNFVVLYGVNLIILNVLKIILMNENIIFIISACLGLHDMQKENMEYVYPN